MNTSDQNTATPEILTIPPAQFLMLNSKGAPDRFLEMANTLRTVVTELGQTPSPLEALWWTTDGSEMSPQRPEYWRWTIMVKLEEPINEATLAQITSHLNNPLLDQIYLETYEEGKVVQVTYTGSLRDKAPVLEQMLSFAKSKDYKPQGKYHEIYYDDPGPESSIDAKSLIRQPITKQIL